MEIKKHLLEGNSSTFRATVHKILNATQDINFNITLVSNEELNKVEQILNDLRQLKNERIKINQASEAELQKTIFGGM